MHCKIINTGKGTAIVCGRPRPRPCAYCGAPHTRLCDYPLDKNVAEYRTCDTPMCDRCTHRAGREEDYCREHRPQEADALSKRIIVVNYKHDREGVIYIGRAMPRYGLPGSDLGNPYRAGVDADPLRLYKRWLWSRIQGRTQAFVELCRIKDLVLAGQTIKLACWCAPLDCHGNIVKAAIEWMIKEGV